MHTNTTGGPADGRTNGLSTARRDMAALREQRDLARNWAVTLEAELGRAEATIARVEALVDPAAQRAQPLYGSRYFDEADMRKALAWP